MLKRLARNLLLILWGIVLGVLMLEIGLRIFPALLPGPLLLERSLHKTKIYANDEYLIVKQKPNLDMSRDIAGFHVSDALYARVLQDEGEA